MKEKREGCFFLQKIKRKVEAWWCRAQERTCMERQISVFSMNTLFARTIQQSVGVHDILYLLLLVGGWVRAFFSHTLTLTSLHTLPY
jgi:hypothetical protein